VTDDEHRRLLARAVRAEEDAAELRARLAACYEEVAAVRALVPARLRQVDFTSTSTRQHPLERLFLAIVPRRP
jgi:hypothetical protein